MSDRISATFAKTRAEKRAALIPFIMGYDPDAHTTAELLKTLPSAGADIIEIGIPFSDPMADGPVIQAAGNRALDAGATLRGVLDIVKAFRLQNTATPIILMGYYNPIYRYGVEAFCRDAQLSGVDGLIIVDLPPEEEEEIRPYLGKANLHLIRLIAPTSDDARLRVLNTSASGFVYYISVSGITGAKSADAEQLKVRVAHLKASTSLPIAVGFGIKTPEQVRHVSGFADAVVVGSALVNTITSTKGDKIQAATDFVRALAQGLKG